MDIFDTDINLATTTKQNYISNVKNIRIKTGLTLHDFEVKDPQTIMEALRKEFSESSGYYKNVLTTISKYLTLKEKPRKEYKIELRRLADTYIKNREKNQKNEKEIKNWIEFEQLQSFCETKLQNEINQDSLIIASYILLPPVRNDWNSVKIYHYDASLESTDNYIEEGKLILNKYKTSKNYGKIIFQLPPTYLIFLDKFLQTTHDKTKEYLFNSPRFQTKFTKSNFSKKLCKIFKEGFPDKQINIQMLRKIFTSQETFQNLETSRQVSKIMGHSLIEHFRYYKTQTVTKEKKKAVEEMLCLLNRFLPDDNLLNYIEFNINKWEPIIT